MDARPGGKAIKDVRGRVERQFGWSLLAQLGITCQKPLHRAQERDEVLVEQWLRADYPKIKALAQRERPRSSLATPLTCGPIIMPGARGVEGEAPIVETMVRAIA